MTPRSAPLTVLALTALGALLGYGVGPFLARGEDTVQLAARVWLEESENLAERTVETDAFRATGEEPAALYERASVVEKRFTWGGLVLGAFCGLVVGLKAMSAARPAHEPFYHIDHAACVACGRCFRYCPREQARLKRLRGQASPEAEAVTAQWEE